MVTNNQATVTVSTNANDALNALKAARATHPFRGTGYNGIGFDDGEQIRSFEGIGFPTWEDDKDTEKKGTYVLVSFNGKRIALNSFVKDKYLLKSSGELEEWKQTEGFAKFVQEHPFRSEMTETELLNTINAYNVECTRLASSGAKFSAIFGVSVQGGYPHKVGKYSIIG